MTSKFKHSIRTEKEKIIFQFTLMLIASIVCGMLFSKLLSDSALQSSADKIVRHFCNQDIDGNMLSAFKKYYILFCIPSIICVAVVFIFSFSFVNYVVTDTVLVFLGFRYGFNSALIAVSALSKIGIFHSLVYWILHAVIIAVALIYSCRMAFYSLTLRSFSANGRLIVERKALLSSLIFTLTVVGLILIVGGVYCFFVVVI